MESNDKLEQMLKQMYAQEALHDDRIDTSDIIDEEWTKFEAEHFGSEKRKVISDKFSFLKIAAMFIGVLMLGGIAYATIQFISSGCLRKCRTGNYPGRYCNFLRGGTRL